MNKYGWQVCADGKEVAVVETYKQALNVIAMRKLNNSDGRDCRYNISVK